MDFAYFALAIFGQVYQKAGLVGAASAVLALLVLVLAARAIWEGVEERRQDRIAQRAAAQRAAQLREEAAMAERGRQEREHQALVAELSETRVQVHAFLTNHLEHLKVESEERQKETAALIRAGDVQAETLRAISQSLNEHREEARREFRSISTDMAAIRGSINGGPRA